MYSHSGRSFARDDNDTEGKGYGRKQMAARNKLHRGITLIRKDADFPLVSHCMNRDKLRNMRKSNVATAPPTAAELRGMIVPSLCSFVFI